MNNQGPWLQRIFKKIIVKTKKKGAVQGKGSHFHYLEDNRSEMNLRAVSSDYEQMTFARNKEGFPTVSETKQELPYCGV